ncbi:D-aminoacyl-tRNA deacylase [Candidatus Marinimicrobia bacterium]|nr:D-aminoacyl-tRNA deacylase [Candidatus Neomarinimicrobiota bacterium]
MISVIQRCSRGKVTVSQKIIGQIDHGLVIFLGVQKDDSKIDADFLVNKISGLRIFADKNDKMNLSIKDVNGSALVISQFTLCGDTKKGRRPSFIKAATPDDGNRLYEYFMLEMKKGGVPIESGEFGAMMDVELVNNGPVTFVLNSKD